MASVVQGLDRADAPAAADAKRMLDSIGGRWWNVYIGGPQRNPAARSWTPKLVGEYARRGIDRFMLTYVGRQKGGPLTRAQGQADGKDALEIAKSFGYSGDFPLCLDVERGTFDKDNAKTIEYVRAWCAAVRKGGARPGVYSNPVPLKAMAKGRIRADFVWVASWVSGGVAAHDPHAATAMPANLWSRPGQRAWQYANERQVLGKNVDLNVADLSCLALAPGVEPGAVAPLRKHRRGLRRGDRGAAVVRLTHRLSVLRSRQTKRPYLDGPRRRFDAETEAALRAFQTEHGLVASGAYGPKTGRALLKAVRHAKELGQLAHQHALAEGNGRKPAIGATRLTELVHDFRRLDAAADRAWQQLEAYGRKRQRLLAHARTEADSHVTLADVTASLARIEKQLATLVDLEKREVALAEEPEVRAEAVTAHIGEAIGGAITTGRLYPPAEAVGALGGSASISDGDPYQPARPRRALADLSDEELNRRIDQLDRRLDRARQAGIARYARVEKELVPLIHRDGGAPKPGGGKKHTSEPGGSNGSTGTAGPALVATDRVRALQRALNRFTTRRLKGVTPLVVDGKKGTDTEKRIRRVKYYLGYGDAERRSAAVTRAFVRRLRHPRSPRFSGPAMLVRAARRRQKQRKNAALSALTRPHGKVVLAPGADRAGVPTQQPLINFLAHVAGVAGRKLIITTGSNHKQFSSAGLVSDHWVGLAADLGCTANGFAVDSDAGTRIAAAALRSAGVPADRALQLARGGGGHNVCHNGWRIQTIWRTGGHHDHVHVGIKRGCSFSGVQSFQIRE